MKIDRLVGIIMVLLEKERVSAQELAERFEVSVRTIYRDIDAIARTGIPIRTFPGVGGGFEIMPGYKVDRSVFSVDDLSAMISGLVSFSDAVHGAGSANALAKLKGLIPPGYSKEIELKTNRLSVDFSPWTGDRLLEDRLEKLRAALDGNRLLNMTYMDTHGDRTERTVEPYQLVLKNARWYFQAYCRMREDWRIFRLARIIDLTVSAETFEPREFEKPQLHVQKKAEAERENVTLRVHRSIVERVLDYCTFDYLRQDGDSHYIVQLPFMDRDYYYDILLGFGPLCECLGPEHVRGKLIDRIRRLSQVYAPEIYGSD